MAEVYLRNVMAGDAPAASAAWRDRVEYTVLAARLYGLA